MWIAAAAVLVLGLIPCGWIALRRSQADAVVALQASSMIASLALLLLAVGYDRSIYVDVAVVTDALGFPGALVFVRFLERWA